MDEYGHGQWRGGILHRGVIGVLTGLTSTLSRCSYTDEDSLARRKGQQGNVAEEDTPLPTSLH